jgi:hypothetical protein
MWSKLPPPLPNPQFQNLDSESIYVNLNYYDFVVIQKKIFPLKHT